MGSQEWYALLPELARVCQYYFEFRHRRSAFAMLPPDGFRRTPRISDRGYSTRSTTDYRLLAVSWLLTAGAPALDEAALTEWLGHAQLPQRPGRQRLQRRTKLLQPLGKRIDCEFIRNA
jgi:hypothetical protein